MGVKFGDEDNKSISFCWLIEYWDHLVTFISVMTVNTLYCDSIVEALFSKEVCRKFSIETSTRKVKVIRGWSKEKGENLRSKLRSKLKEKISKIQCWYYNKWTYLKNCNALIYQFTSMCIKTKEKDKIVMLLCLLPKSFKHLVTSIIFSSINTLNCDYIMGALLSKFVQMKFSIGTSTL